MLDGVKAIVLDLAGASDTIVFAPDTQGGLMKVSARGWMSCRHLMSMPPFAHWVVPPAQMPGIPVSQTWPPPAQSMPLT